MRSTVSGNCHDNVLMYKVPRRFCSINKNNKNETRINETMNFLTSRYIGLIIVIVIIILYSIYLLFVSSFCFCFLCISSFVNIQSNSILFGIYFGVSSNLLFPFSAIVYVYVYFAFRLFLPKYMKATFIWKGISCVWFGCCWSLYHVDRKCFVCSSIELFVSLMIVFFLFIPICGETRLIFDWFVAGALWCKCNNHLSFCLESLHFLSITRDRSSHPKQIRWSIRLTDWIISQ